VQDYNQFAEAIKKKYPYYAKEDNKALASAMIEKFPYYKDRVAMETSSEMRSRAKSEYEKERQALKVEALGEFAQKHPYISALLPSTAQNAALGDRGMAGEAYGAARDVLSLPGRVTREAVGTAAEAIGGGAPTRESVLSNLGRQTVSDGSGVLGKAADVVSNIVTDPYTLAMAPLGGPIARGLGKIASRGAQALAGAGAGAATNAAIGAAERGYNRREDIRAMDPASIAQDVAIGAGLPLAGAGLAAGFGRVRNYGTRLSRPAVTAEELSDVIPNYKAEVDALKEAYQKTDPLDRQTALNALGEDVMPQRADESASDAFMRMMKASPRKGDRKSVV
jgi:hypothetical protein